MKKLKVLSNAMYFKCEVLSYHNDVYIISREDLPKSCYVINIYSFRIAKYEHDNNYNIDRNFWHVLVAASIEGDLPYVDIPKISNKFRKVYFQTKNTNEEIYTVWVKSKAKFISELAINRIGKDFINLNWIIGDESTIPNFYYLKAMYGSGSDGNWIYHDFSSGLEMNKDFIIEPTIKGNNEITLKKIKIPFENYTEDKIIKMLLDLASDIDKKYANHYKDKDTDLAKNVVSNFLNESI